VPRTGGSTLAMTTTTATIPAHELRQGDKVLVYGDVRATITDVELLPAGKPVRMVKLRYRCESFTGWPLMATMTALASHSFPTWDDGEAF
jgi:hypothetical protein